MYTVKARVNMCDTNFAAFPRAQITCVYVSSHLKYFFGGFGTKIFFLLAMFFLGVLAKFFFLGVLAKIFLWPWTTFLFWFLPNIFIFLGLGQNFFGSVGQNVSFLASCCSGSEIPAIIVWRTADERVMPVQRIQSLSTISSTCSFRGGTFGPNKLLSVTVWNEELPTPCSCVLYSSQMNAKCRYPRARFFFF